MLTVAMRGSFICRGVVEVYAADCLSTKSMYMMQNVCLRKQVCFVDGRLVVCACVASSWMGVPRVDSVSAQYIKSLTACIELYSTDYVHPVSALYLQM